MIFNFFGGSTTPCPTCDSRVSTNARACPHCGEIFKKQDDNSFVTQLIIYLVAIGLIIWLAIWLLFNLVIPLFVINIPAIALILAFRKKLYKPYFLPLSFFGALLVTADYNFGWFTKTLSVHVSFLGRLVPCLCIANVLCGLVAAYLFIRAWLNRKDRRSYAKGEFSGRNLVIMGSLMVFGALLLWLPGLVAKNRAVLSIPRLTPAMAVQATPTIATSPSTVATAAPEVMSPKTKIITRQFNGYVGHLDAIYTLTWFSDSSIEGYYSYPSRLHSHFMLRGTDKGYGNIKLTEFTNDVQSAQCFLGPERDCYVGKMNNTDGRIFDMALCPDEVSGSNR